MRSTRLRSLFVAAAAVCLFAGSAAAADRASCDDLLAARDNGQADEEIAAYFRTTTVKVEACARIAEQRQRLAENKQHVDAARAERQAAR